MNLPELLHKLQSAEDELTLTEHDFSDLIGDVKDKVDHIRFVRDRLISQIAWLEKRLEEVKHRIHVAEKNKKNLENYVNWSLTQAGIEECPGFESRVKVQKNPVSVKVEGNPTVEDFAALGDLVKMKVTYSWDMPALKKTAEAGELPDRLQHRVSLEQGTHVRFYSVTPRLKATKDTP